MCHNTEAQWLVNQVKSQSYQAQLTKRMKQKIYIYIYSTMKSEHQRHRRLKNRELNQARSKLDAVHRSVRTARTTVHHYNATQYCNTETVLLVVPFLRRKIMPTI